MNISDSGDMKICPHGHPVGIQSHHSLSKKPGDGHLVRVLQHPGFSSSFLLRIPFCFNRSYINTRLPEAEL